MTENRNRKKRIRDNEEPHNGPTNSANAPPTKKRRVQMKAIENIKSRNKDMSKWSIDELRRYLNENAITYQMNKEKPYYLRLAQIHRIKKNKDEKQRQIQRKSSFPSSMMNGGNSSNRSNDSTQPQSPRDNSNNDNSETPNSPIFSRPKRSTPPLPPNLSRRPLTADNNDEDDDSDDDEDDDLEEEEELSQTNLSQNKPRTMIKTPPQIITPDTYKSRPIIHRVTPSQPPQITTHHQQEQEEEEERVSAFDINTNIPTPITTITPPRQFDVDVDVQESSNSGFSHQSNGNNQEITNNGQRISYQHGAAQNIPYQQSAPTETRMGPFQDQLLRKVFNFDGYSMPQIPKMRGIDIPSLNRGILGGENKYLILLCGAVAIILMAMCIPYIIALFVPTPFCDDGGDGISGTYAVLNGIVPLQSIMSCKSCPFAAKCVNGIAECDDNYHLDDPYNVICLDPKHGDDAKTASDIAHRVNYFLGEKYGEYVCDNSLGDESYAFYEESLKNEIKRKYYHVVEDKDDSQQSVESSSDDSDNIHTQQNADKSDDNQREQQEDEAKVDNNDTDNDEDEGQKRDEIDEGKKNQIDEAETNETVKGEDEQEEVEETEDVNSDKIDDNDDGEKRDEIDNNDTDDDEDEGQKRDEIDEGDTNETDKGKDVNGDEIQKPSPELNDNEDDNVNEPVSDVLNEEIGHEKISDSSFDSSWDYAQKTIIPSAYKSTIIYEESKYKSLRPIPPTYYCRGLYLYHEYIEKPQKNIEVGIIWGFALIVIVVLTIILCLLNKAKEADPEAIGAANFVLEKLSHQQTLHFSIDLLKRYCMNRQNISLKTWEKALEYINESSFVEVIPEDIDGHIRMCWKWKAPVPFVPLQVN